MYYHEGGELFADDVELNMAVLPEVATSSTAITIDDVQVGDPGIPLTEDQERLRQLRWKNKHLLFGKSNDLLCRQRCGMRYRCGGAKKFAQRVRAVAPKFRENLLDLIKGLLS